MDNEDDSREDPERLVADAQHRHEDGDAAQLDSESAIPPSEVETAFWLWIAAIVLVVLVIIFDLPSEETLEQMIVEKISGQEISFDPIWASRTVGMARPVIQCASVVAAVGWLLIARQMRTGHNWARTVLSILGAVHITVMLTRIVHGPSFGTTATSLVIMAFLIIIEMLAIVRAYRPAARAYFTRT